MILDKTDLIAIGDLIDLKLKPIETRLDHVENNLNQVQIDVKSIDKKVDRIKKDTTYLINGFDRELMDCVKRTARLERHQDLPPLQ
jgi:hypothetical protein